MVHNLIHNIIHTLLQDVLWTLYPSDEGMRGQTPAVTASQLLNTCGKLVVAPSSLQNCGWYEMRKWCSMLRVWDRAWCMEQTVVEPTCFSAHWKCWCPWIVACIDHALSLPFVNTALSVDNANLLHIGLATFGWSSFATLVYFQKSRVCLVMS